jgi:far upstream element-binding protein
MAGGETIKQMQSETGCKINVSQASGADIEREIGLVGSRQAIDDAKQAIWDKVDQVVSTSPIASQEPTNSVQKEKNNSRRRDQGGQDNSYSQPQAQPSYGQAAPQGQHPVPAAGAPAGGAADPYAIYGGYQNYLAMWYASFAQQQQQGGAPPGPPGA